jgi:hypothetical protein
VTYECEEYLNGIYHKELVQVLTRDIDDDSDDAVYEGLEKITEFGYNEY